MISARELRSRATDLDPRPMCYKCFRPESYCVCNLVKPFNAHTNFLILQHPHERRKYHSSTKIVLSAIQNSRLLRGITFNPDEVMNLIPNQTPYILYPSKDAIDCKEVALDKNSTVIVIDGTWIEARKLMFRNPFLRALPKLTFKETIRSQYKIRRQPKDNCLSTLECIGHLLLQTASAEEVKNYKSLLIGFDQMVETQLKYFPRMSNRGKSSIE